MTGKKLEKEATLREVLAEVSLVDLGGMLKRGFATIGCWTLMFAIIFLITTISEGAGYGWDTLGIPDWILWVLIAWLWVHIATSQRSSHEWNVSWYFPKLNWFGSLFLSAYLVGFVYLFLWVIDLEVGLERFGAFLALWFGYTAPFVLLLSATNAGYEKLMEKRRAALAENLTEHRGRNRGLEPDFS